MMNYNHFQQLGAMLRKTLENLQEESNSEKTQLLTALREGIIQPLSAANNKIDTYAEINQTINLFNRTIASIDKITELKRQADVHSKTQNNHVKV